MRVPELKATGALVAAGNLVLSLVVAVGAVQAGGGPDERGHAPVLERLSAERAALEQELASVRLERERQQSAASARADELANELIGLELERISLEQTLPALHEDLQAARERLAARRTERERVRSGMERLAEQLRLHVAELPASSEEERLAGEVLELLAAGQEQQAWALLLPLVQDLDRSARSPGLRTVELRTAGGRLESVELLSVGHAAFAYRVGARIGLAFAAPRSASGLRWREDLDEASRSLWNEAFQSIAAADGPTLWPVLDVSGSLRVDSELAGDGALDLFLAGGPIMWPLAALAALCTLLVGERVWVLYLRDGPGNHVGEQVLTALLAGDEEGAREAAARGRGSAARTIAALLAAPERSRSALEGRLEEAVLGELPILRRSLRGLAVLGAVAPLLGLLGTITGIIDTFDVLRGGDGDPGRMAGGISEALLTTATGLVVAIPVLLAHGLLRGRVERLLATAEGQGVRVLNALERANPWGGGRP